MFLWSRKRIKNSCRRQQKPTSIPFLFLKSSSSPLGSALGVRRGWGGWYGPACNRSWSWWTRWRHSSGWGWSSTPSGWSTSGSARLMPSPPPVPGLFFPMFDPVGSFPTDKVLTLSCKGKKFNFERLTCERRFLGFARLFWFFCFLLGRCVIVKEDWVVLCGKD